MTDVHLPTLHPELEALARRALKHLESLGYSESSLSYFELTWRRLCVFAQEQSLPDGLSEDLLDQFLAHHHVPATAAERTGFHRHLRRATGVLAQFAVHGAVARRIMKRAPSPVPAPMLEVLTQYLTYAGRTSVPARARSGDDDSTSRRSCFTYISMASIAWARSRPPTCRASSGLVATTPPRASR